MCKRNTVSLVEEQLKSIEKTCANITENYVKNRKGICLEFFAPSERVFICKSYIPVSYRGGGQGYIIEKYLCY